MTPSSQKQLVDFLSDMYSVEQQAISQLVSGAKIAGDPSLAAMIGEHEQETELQAQMVGERLEAYGEKVSALKEAIMKLGGKGFALFAALMPETPGRLTAHAYSYEAMEWAGYEMLARFARAADDEETEQVAKTIGAQERQMLERLESAFDTAEAVSHEGMDADKMSEHVLRHLNEAHALESQAVKLFEKSKQIAHDPALASACESSLEQAKQNAAQLEQRLAALGSSPSALKDLALGLGGANWGMFFQAQDDTPAKLVAFAYAYEHLKLAGYQLLLRSAGRAGDHETAALCETLISGQQKSAEQFAATFDSVAAATLAMAKAKT